MEKLEKIIEKAEPELRKELSSVKSYGGLVLLEDKKYTGPTSIRYWM